MFAALQAILTAIVGWFGAKAAAVAAAAAAFTAMTVAFTAAINGVLDITVPSLPTWAVIGFAILPVQTPIYIAAYVSAVAARRVYDISVTALGFRV